MNDTLKGIRVVELSTFIAVPACARFFADLGAEVVKIEAASGDAVRWNGTSEGRPDDPYENTTFDLENANKKGVVLNLKAPEGKEALMRLLEKKEPGLQATDVFSDHGYQSEHDALNLLHRLGNVYEPVRFLKDPSVSGIVEL